jgi:cysteinyl-tRNA synthetase
MIAGARVEVAPYKEDPMDFVLWKPSDADLPGWDSPWGRGRPGWHIECSAMAQKLLGEEFDIHGGGLDLQFPHHENEIAQSCCAFPGKGFARTWLHNEMLQVDGKKMSKSLGNFFTVRDLLDQGYPGEVIRFVYLSTHYRKPMDWTAEKAREAEKTLDWLYSIVGQETFDERWSVNEKVVEAIAQDINTSLAISELVEQAKGTKPSTHPDADGSDQMAAAELKRTAHLLGLLTMTDDQWRRVRRRGVDLLPYQNELERLRREAVATKNFSLVDAMRSELAEAGVEVRVSKAGVQLLPGADFNPTKLEAIK